MHNFLLTTLRAALMGDPTCETDEISQKLKANGEEIVISDYSIHPDHHLHRRGTLPEAIHEFP
ncbi:unnamed protein product [Arabidopsis lyrata]|nr:unnamed protein product [Arabidopsis lyrata]